MQQRYDNDVKTRTTWLASPQNYTTTGQPPNTSGFVYQSAKAIADWLDGNGIGNLSKTTVIYHWIGRNTAGTPVMVTSWVGDQLHIAGVQITDQKTGKAHKIPLPTDFLKDLNEQQASYVSYTAILPMDEEAFQALTKAEAGGDKLDLLAY